MAKIKGSLTVSKDVTIEVTTGTKPLVISSNTMCDNLNADYLDGNHANAFAPAFSSGNMTATSPILVDQTRQVIGGAVVISHATTAGNIHLPTGGSSNQILKNSGTSGTGAWGTVTESSGALAAITTIGMSGALTNTLAIGNAPLVVTSTTVCTNLNADMVDGRNETEFLLLTGRTGGQTVNGGTAASQNLTLISTAHATKGNILFGTSAYDEVNNRLGIGLTNPFHALSVLGTFYCTVANSDTVLTGQPTQTGFVILGNNAYWGIRENTAHSVCLDVYNGGSTLNALTITQAGNTQLIGNLQVNGLNIGTSSDNDIIVLATNSVTVNGTIDALISATYTRIGSTINTSGLQGVSLSYSGTEAFITSVHAGTAWKDFTIQAANLRFDGSGVADKLVITNAGTATFAGNITAQAGSIIAGVSTTQQGVFKSAGSATVGGLLWLYNATDYAATFAYWSLQPKNSNTIRFGPNTSVEAFIFDYRGGFQMGDKTADYDIPLTFNGETNIGILTWMEDEDYFAFNDDILLNTTENIYFRDTAISIKSADDGHLDLTADTSIDLNGATVITGTLKAEQGFDYQLTTLLHDDFMSASGASCYNWSTDFELNAPTMTATNVSSNHWGIVRIACSDNDYTDYCTLFLGTDIIKLGASTVVYRTSIYIGQLSTALQEFELDIGIADSTALSAHADAVHFRYKRATSVNWLMCTANNSTRTETASSTAVAATAWLDLKIIIINATSAEFFVNDVSIGTVTTNLPGTTRATTLLVRMIKTSGSNSVYTDVDYIKLAAKFNVTR